MTTTPLSADVLVIGWGLAASSRRRRHSMPGGASSWWIRSRARISAVRPGGLSGACSSSTPRSSDASASRTPSNSRPRTGSATPDSSRRRRMAPPLGAGVPAVRGRREARLASRTRRRLLPRRRLGGARRLRGDRTGQLRPPLPHHLGTGPGIVAPFAAAVEQGERDGRLTILPRHRVGELTVADGTVTGARGDILATSGCGARRAIVSRGDRRVPDLGDRHDRLLRRDRRQLTTSCEQRGPNGSAPHPTTCSRGCRHMSTARCTV